MGIKQYQSIQWKMPNAFHSYKNEFCSGRADCLICIKIRIGVNQFIPTHRK